MIALAERLKILRIAKGITQVDMAKELGCTEQHYQRIEYGKINIPTSTLIALANYFEVSLDYLVGRTDVKEINKS